MLLGGNAIVGREVGAQASKDLGLAEALAFPLIAILAFLIFRGVARCCRLPSAGPGSSRLRAAPGVNVALPLSVFALNLVIGLGLGLAVDYSLFMVSRFREELGAGHDTAAALATTMNTAGRTVAYSAVTVALRCARWWFPAALPAVDGHRRGDHRADGGGRRPDPAAGAVRAVGRAPGTDPAGTAPGGSLVPPCPPRPAPSGAGRPAHGRGADRLALPAFGTHWSGVDARVLPPPRAPRRSNRPCCARFRWSHGPCFVAVTPARRRRRAPAYTARLASVGGVAASPPLVTSEADVADRRHPRREAIGAGCPTGGGPDRGAPSDSSPQLGGSGAEFTDQRARSPLLPLALAILVGGTLLLCG